jgi:hypothetical protein
MPDQIPLISSPPIKVRGLTGAKQPLLFSLPEPTNKQIRELVKSRLYGLEFRQRFREQKRKERNRQIRGRKGLKPARRRFAGA